MSRDQAMCKKVYDETAGAIMSLQYKKRINGDEMHFLLNILEEIIIKKRQPELRDSLRQWLEGSLEPETNEIIKATLLAADFNDPDEMGELVKLIKEYLK